MLYLNTDTNLEKFFISQHHLRQCRIQPCLNMLAVTRRKLVLGGLYLRAADVHQAEEPAQSVLPLLLNHLVIYMNQGC